MAYFDPTTGVLKRGIRNQPSVPPTARPATSANEMAATSLHVAWPDALLPALLAATMPASTIATPNA